VGEGIDDGSIGVGGITEPYTVDGTTYCGVVIYPEQTHMGGEHSLILHDYVSYIEIFISITHLQFESFTGELGYYESGLYFSLREE
jgi:hypothetical protein